ncbi:MAG TPA: cell envelope integrity protein TolA [Luteimonas sp.]|nr:cell envelope integrity protein TolA [Luteimonas sp.]
MRERPADARRAIGLSLLLHAALIGLMFAGFLWERSSTPASAAGSPISAELIDADALSAAMQRTLEDRPEPVQTPAPAPDPLPEPQPEPVPEDAAPLPQPLPEQVPEDAPTPPRQVAQEQVPEPAPVDQDAVRRDAISAETREREQEEKRRQEQIDLTERERADEAERRQRLARQQQEDRERQLAEIRRQRAAAAREAELLEEKQKQLANRRAQQASEAARNAAAATAPATAEPPGNDGVDAGLSARYAAALQDAILRNWTRPDNVPLGQVCQISIRQLPGGEVIEVTVSPSCPYDEQGRRSVDAAVRKAQPLPYAGFEAVFQRNLRLNFKAADR